MDRLISSQEAAELLSICRKTLYRIVKRGQLTVVRIGRQAHLRESDVQKLIAEGGAPLPRPRRKGGR
jgi:excisionase family DNA binding protein